MVLIVTNENDVSTFKVVDWLTAQKKTYKLVHHKSGIFIDKIKLSSENSTLKLKHYSDISSFWFRKGDLIIDIQKVKIPLQLESKEKLISQINYELKVLSQFLNKYILGKCQNIIGNMELTENINKLDILKSALEVGLRIPDTIITSSKQELIKFKNKYKDIISKPISESIILHERGCNIYTYTSPISDTDTFPESFFPSLFQEAIEKLYELRVFYLKGTFFSCAIFSQIDEKTKHDFRNYNIKKPNRYVPFQLPKQMELKIDRLMRKVKFDSGSIDLIVDKNEVFYFLEINPVGQFGMIAMPCNYNIYKEISKNLI